jgi:hypothetical protein
MAVVVVGVVAAVASAAVVVAATRRVAAAVCGHASAVSDRRAYTLYPPSTLIT